MAWLTYSIPIRIDPRWHYSNRNRLGDLHVTTETINPIRSIQATPWSMSPRGTFNKTHPSLSQCLMLNALSVTAGATVELFKTIFSISRNVTLNPSLSAVPRANDTGLQHAFFFAHAGFLGVVHAPASATLVYIPDARRQCCPRPKDKIEQRKPLHPPGL